MESTENVEKCRRKRKKSVNMELSTSRKNKNDY